ncbi:MAG: hypothetical protein EU548_01840 [Promethearchaeota archaeon]|nr:MAG: hypothetical protein EU548_01840 [Candidatus Lokiarchaeota archaeon]
MKIYETGLIFNNKLLLKRRYFEESTDQIENEKQQLICRTFIDTMKRTAEYNDELTSYELFNYHLSLIGKKNGSKSKFIMYIVSDKKMGLDLKNKLLKELFEEFFKSFPPPSCYNVNKNSFNGFYDKVDKIIGDLSLKPSERLYKAFGK